MEFLALLFIPLWVVLNRIRGGWILPAGGAWVAGAVGLALPVWWLTGMSFALAGLWATISIYAAYVIGESFGWSKYIGTIHGYSSFTTRAGLTQAEFNAKWAGKDSNWLTYPWDKITNMIIDERKDWEKSVFLGMTLRFAFWNFPIFLTLWWWDLISLIPALISAAVASVLAPVVYKMGAEKALGAYGPNADPDKLRYLETAELYYGGVFGSALAFAFIASKFLFA